MNHFLKVIFAFSVILGSYYYIDNSMERVQDTTIKELTYVMQGDNRNPAYKKQQEERLDFILNKMKDGGFEIDENLLTALEKNSYIHNIKWNLKTNAYRGLDEVILNFMLGNQKIKIPIKITFFVVPKASLMKFISDLGLAKLYPLLVIEIENNGRTAKFTNNKAYEMLLVFYNNIASENFLKQVKH